MKKKTSIIFAIALMIFLALGLVAWRLVDSLADRNVDVAAAREELASETSVMRSMEQIRRSVLTSADEQEELASYFVTEESIPVFLGDLEAIAVSLGIDLSISGVSGGENSLSVGLRANGAFANLHQYVALLERAPYRIEVRRMFFQRTPAQNPLLGESYPWSADIDIILLSYQQSL